MCLTGLMGLASLTGLISLYFTNYSTTTDKEWWSKWWWRGGKRRVRCTQRQAEGRGVRGRAQAVQTEKKCDRKRWQGGNNLVFDKEKKSRRGRDVGGGVRGRGERRRIGKCLQKELASCSLSSRRCEPSNSKWQLSLINHLLQEIVLCCNRKKCKVGKLWGKEEKQLCYKNKKETNLITSIKWTYGTVMGKRTVR